jgi:enoyl-CoA hydratase/carnithine racemase
MSSKPSLVEDSKEVHDGLNAAWDRIAADDSVDVVILTGTGDAFCGGMDLKTHVTKYINATPQMIADWVPLGLGGLTRGKHRFKKPVIAAVNGWALAGGFELAMSADIRIASDQAKFGSFEARRGFHHGDGSRPTGKLLWRQRRHADGAHRRADRCAKGIADQPGI